MTRGLRRRLRAGTAIVLAMAVIVPASLLPPVALASHTATPTMVNPAGSWQSELGCPGDWQPDCVATSLTLEDGVWQGAFAIPDGSYEFKAALNGGWDENYGANGAPGGANASFTVGGGSTKFYYSHATHWITSNRTATIATVAGSFQSEIGCTGDWDPSCLRSWLQDVDGDGTYNYTATELPAGNYEFKVALNESWSTSYPADNVAFTVESTLDKVRFSYQPGNGNAVDVTVDSLTPPDPEDVALARDSVRERLTRERFYFVLPDRFENGRTDNDTGGSNGTRSDHGFDPTDKGYYHGGDIKGVHDRLAYLEGLGITAIWMAPIFKNRPVQGEGANESAGYHGYWITDFTQVDPHFGTNQELKDLITEAHSRGIKVFFDIITNHTADVIAYEEGTTSYRSKADFPYVDANGDEFDDRDYAGTNDFPPLDLGSFPYTPVFRTSADATVKVPSVLNDRRLYHNRGDSTFAGESSNYGDFVGLDDLFTEHPTVVQTMIDVHKTWVTDAGIDGFRIDTVKHVNDEFWQAFSPALLSHADAVDDSGDDANDFFMFGEIFDGDPAFVSKFTTRDELPAALDFPFQGAARSFASQSGTRANLRELFEKDDYYIDADSNAYNLPTFLGNHDMGRFGAFLKEDNTGALDSELLARDKLGHALMYLSRGQPVVYYGDEQGYTKPTGQAAGDKNARQDMFPSLTADYATDDQIGTTDTPANDNFDTDHPMYTELAALGALVEAHPALRDGAQIQRVAGTGAGIFAFSRLDPAEGQRHEYVVALNNAESEQTAAVPTYEANQAYTRIYGSGAASVTSDGSGAISVTLPSLGYAVYRADDPVTDADTAPNVTVTAPAADATVTGRPEISATVSGTEFAQVTFAVKVGDATEWTVAGTDDNAPYRVFFDVSSLAPGTPVTCRVVVKDLGGNVDSDTCSFTVGGETPGAGGTAPDYALVHYWRGDGDYHYTDDAGQEQDGYGLHLWGDTTQATTWPATVPFQGTDDYMCTSDPQANDGSCGRWAWVKLANDPESVGFIVHKGDSKDPDGDRSFDPGTTPEIWLKTGDSTVYTSQAAAQGYVTIHYHRDDANYSGWGVHLWGDGLASGEGTTWDAPKQPTGTDAYGAYWKVNISDASKAVNFIIHKGDEKDPGPDQTLMPQDQPSAWIQSGDATVYRTRAASENAVVIHYHRPDGDYGNYGSTDYNDFWGLHTWGTAADPGWTTPRKPAGRDGFGVYFRVPLTEANATSLNYILHRGDTKDPGPDQVLDIATYGHEVWYLSGHVDADGNAKYVRPIVGGGGAADANLSKQKAHWLSEDVIAWKLDAVPSGRYYLTFAPTGGLDVGPSGLTGGDSIRLSRIAGGIPDALQAKFPHLAGYAAFRIPEAELPRIPEILKGQIAVAAVDADDSLVAATGIQIPGVLDDLYTYTGSLGVSWSDGRPTLRLWAPTAKSVRLHVYAGGAGEAGHQELAMTRGSDGVWSRTVRAALKDLFYQYEVEVYVPSTGQVEHNFVTDPYSISLSQDSTRSQIVDLNDPLTKPTGWDSVRKPAFGDPEDITLYELHVRDFSRYDPAVPAAERGTFRAFRHLQSNGMKHLRRLAEEGLTHIHLLPAFDCATINEDKSEWQSPSDSELAGYPRASEEQQAKVEATRSQDGFNWCYDPYHYTAPEGSYSTDPNGRPRITQFREMVKSLNESGLRVVMDVVYNHTAASGQAEKSVLDRAVPGYYHRLDLEGGVETSTCCANTASEHAMMEKLMVDSLVTWARAYKVDGFRFDLMGHHSKANLLKVRAALDALTPANSGVNGKRIYVYGEGWNFGEVANDARFVQATQANMAGTGIGTFNDRLRDAVRGGGPFDGDPRIQGFASGLWYDQWSGDYPTPPDQGSTAEQKARLLQYADWIKVGLTGNLKSFEFVDRTGAVKRGDQIDYNGSPVGYTDDPQEAITYVSAHDNETLYDALAFKLPQDTSRADRIRAQIVALSTVALGQGVAFFHAGTDMLRSKSLDRNSYDSGDWFNKLDFTYSTNNFGVGLPRKADNESKWPYMRPLLEDPALRMGATAIRATTARFAELLKIRQSSPLFTLGSGAAVKQRVSFENNGPDQVPGLIVMRISDTAGRDLDPRYRGVAVLFNATDEAVQYTSAELKGHRMRLHPVQRASVDPVVRTASFAAADGRFTIPARTTAVFVDLDPTGSFRWVGVESVNRVDALTTVKVRFSLGGFYGTDIFEAGWPKTQRYGEYREDDRVPCGHATPAPDSEYRARPFGSDGLTYDEASDTYTYSWNVAEGWERTCRTLTLGLSDGSFHTARFRIDRPAYRFSWLSPTEVRPTRNTVQAGATVPVRWTLKSRYEYGKYIFDATRPASQRFDCTSGKLVEGSRWSTHPFSWDGLTEWDDPYTYSWKTVAGWAGQCRRFFLTLDDGSVHTADYRFTP